jgi:molybdopterin-guanine dinucleotide biosynthesis protein A
MNILIPAKGVSSRVPKKNLQLLGGVSLVERAIAKAVSWFPESRTFVATEDEEISNIAERYGCSVFPLSDDDTGDRRNASGPMNELFRIHQEPVMLMQCTSPFTDKKDAIAASKDDRDIVRSAWRGSLHRPANGSTLSQHLGDEWFLTGNFWRINREASVADFMDESNFIAVDWLSAMDINTPEDLESARRLFAIPPTPQQH